MNQLHMDNERSNRIDRMVAVLRDYGGTDLTIRDIATKYGITPSHVVYYAKKAGFSRKDGGAWTRKRRLILAAIRRGRSSYWIVDRYETDYKTVARLRHG